MRNHRHRVAGAADRVAGRFDGLDQRRDLFPLGDHHLHVGADGEAHMTFAILVDDVAQQINLVGAELALGAETDGPDLVARVRHVMQHARTRTVVIFPVAEILDHQRMHVLHAVRAAAFDRRAHFHLCHWLCLLIHLYLRENPAATQAVAGCLRCIHFAASWSHSSKRT